MLRLFRLWRLGGQDLKTLWYALRHPRRPVWLLPVTGLLALYVFDPLNFAVLPLGIVDDFILLPLLLHLIVTRLPSDIRYGRALVVEHSPSRSRLR